MAKRPVFMENEMAPFYQAVDVEFVWNRGLAKSQKQKNVKAIHEEFLKQQKGKRVLEISSKSMQEGGTQLSAFSLKKYVPELGKSLPVECVYQAGKVFQNGGPYTDLMDADVTPHDAKTDERLKTSGPMIYGVFNRTKFPPEFFYDYLYINALLENKELAEIVLNYAAFTDIEFNPSKGISCQAKSAAVFLSLFHMDKIELVKSPGSFLALYDVKQQMEVL